METLGSYLLQMACWLTGFWLVYVAALRKETFFELNRWFLLFGLVASLTFPLFPLRYDVVRAPLDFLALKMIGEPVVADTSEGLSITDYLALAYFSGLFLFVFRFVWQSAKLYSLRRISERVTLGKTPIFKLEKDTAPFSFFNSVYISKKMCGDTELKTVVAHEKVHIDERHWADLLLLEVARTLQWFNPLLILYRRAVMQNHEFLADSGTLRNGVSAHTYKAVLANQMLGIPVFQVANGFTISNKPKRILMMNKDKTSPVKRLKLLWALPVMALLMVAFAKPNYVTGEIPNQANKINNASITVKGKVFDQWGNPVSGAMVTANESSQQTVSDDDGNFLIANIKNASDINISKEGYFVVNKIAKNESEVIVLTMKDKTDSYSEKNITVKGKVVEQLTGKPLPGTSIIVRNTTIGTLSDIDGNFLLSGIKPDDELVFSFVGFATVVVKAKKELDVKMLRSVTAIQTRVEETAPPPPPPPPPFVLKGRDGEKPLIVVDGKISTVDINTIDPNTIERVEVLKDQSATAVYGDKGKDGVILITTKKEMTPPPPPPPAEDEVFVVVEDEVFVVVEDMPEFPGGTAALNNYIAKSTAGSNEKGNVVVKFTVDKQGQTVNASVLNSASKRLDKKALEIITSMPKWKPGMQRGKAVDVEFSLEVQF